MSQHSISNSLLNVILVIAESVITLVLRFDPNLRKAMYPLAKNNTIVCVRSYLPHTEIYATFTTKGILLDTELVDDKYEVDVVINAYTHQLIQALISNDTNQINKLTMRGATDTIVLVRQFLVQLGIGSLFQSLIRMVKGKDKSHDDKSEKDDKPDYKALIQEQQEQLHVLSKRNRELEMSLKESQSKQKVMLISLIIASLIAVVAIIGWAM